VGSGPSLFNKGARVHIEQLAAGGCQLHAYAHVHGYTQRRLDCAMRSVSLHHRAARLISE